MNLEGRLEGTQRDRSPWPGRRKAHTTHPHPLSPWAPSAAPGQQVTVLLSP